MIRVKLAELTSGVGALVLGIGLGALLSAAVRRMSRSSDSGGTLSMSCIQVVIAGTPSKVPE